MKVIISASHIELKDIEENSKHSFSFNLEWAFPGTTLDTLKKYKPSCGCMTVDLSYPDLLVKYNASQIPLHLRRIKTHAFKKHIRVFFKDGTEKLLLITGNLKI